MLRQKVWQHLTTLTRFKGKTVIITTHYIEEARGADRVGFMRGGRLLAEGSPSSLMIQHSLTSLESVFLKLCVSDQYKKVLRLCYNILVLYSGLVGPSSQEESMGQITPTFQESPFKGQVVNHSKFMQPPFFELTLK